MSQPDRPAPADAADTPADAGPEDQASNVVALGAQEERSRTDVRLPLDQVHVGERLRAIDPEKLDRLQASLEACGQRQRIEVGPRMVSGKYRGLYRLVTGGHRVEAARRLGWSHIDAVVVDATPTWLRILEIEENLARVELSALDRAVFLAELKVAYEALNPQTRHGDVARFANRNFSADRLPGAQVVDSVQVAKFGHLGAARFTAVAQEKFGLSERSVRREVRLANKLDSRVRARLSGTHWARDRRLLTALGKLDAEQQGRALDWLRKGEPAADALLLARGRPRHEIEAAKAKAAGARRPPSPPPRTERPSPRELAEQVGRMCADDCWIFYQHLMSSGALSKVGEVNAAIAAKRGITLSTPGTPGTPATKAVAAPARPAAPMAEPQPQPHAPGTKDAARLALAALGANDRIVVVAEAAEAMSVEDKLTLHDELAYRMFYQEIRPLIQRLVGTLPPAADDSD